MSRPVRTHGTAALARRLRELRESQWPGRPVTQRQLAVALGGARPLSESSISAYENESNPTAPPTRRLRDYATFFATERSLQNGRGAVLAEDDLTDTERDARDTLQRELLDLAATTAGPLGPSADRPSLWHFPPGDPVRLVCGELTGTDHHPYASTTNPNHNELLRYADSDALIELFAHIRMLNPSCDVRFMLDKDLHHPDDITTHLVILGGAGLNPSIENIVDRTDLPLRQDTASKDVVDGDVFKLGDEVIGLPTMSGALGEVAEDSGLLARLRNPYHVGRTLTLCSGVYSRGVLGAVRTLTDAAVRDRNQDYLTERFAGATEFAILMRVWVRQGQALTPDLHNPRVPLYEWVGAEREGAQLTRDATTGSHR